MKIEVDLKLAWRERESDLRLLLIEQRMKKKEAASEPAKYKTFLTVTLTIE